MENIINELLNSHIEALFQLDYIKKEELFKMLRNHPLKKEVLYKIIPLLIEKRKWLIYCYRIFDLIYLDSNLKDLTCYLLNNKIVPIKNILSSQVVDILTKTSWGADFFLNNLEEAEKFVGASKLVPLLLEGVKSNESIFNFRATKLYYANKASIRRALIIYLLENRISVNDKHILASLYKNPDEFLYEQITLPGTSERKPKLIKTNLPYYLTKIEDESIKELLIKEFPLFFEAEAENKITFTENIKYIDNTIREKYQEIFRLHREIKRQTKSRFLGCIDLDLALTKIINCHQEDFLTDYIKNESIKYENHGSLATAFRIGQNKILKFSMGKHNSMNLTKHFLLAPTSTLTVRFSGNIPLFIEKQEYLTNSYNGIPMTTEDIENFLSEAKKQGIVIADYHCLNKEFNNFGFLKDYKDATLVGVDSYDSLPEWFKKRPLVLFDIDLVYYDESIDKKSPYEKKKTI